MISENFGNQDTHLGLIGIIWIAGMEKSMNSSYNPSNHLHLT